MRTLAPLLACALFSLSTSACSTTFGPVVHDIHTTGNGRLLVEMCNVEIGYRAESAEMKDCFEKVVDVGETFPRHS